MIVVVASPCFFKEDVSWVGGPPMYTLSPQSDQRGCLHLYLELSVCTQIIQNVCLYQVWTANIFFLCLKGSKCGPVEGPQDGECSLVKTEATVKSRKRADASAGKSRWDLLSYKSIHQFCFICPDCQRQYVIPGYTLQACAGGWDIISTKY